MRVPVFPLASADRFVEDVYLLQSLTVGYLGRIFQEFVDTDEELAGVVAVWLGGGS